MNCKFFYPKSVIRSCHGLMTDLGLCYKNIKNMGNIDEKTLKNNTSVLLLKKMKKNYFWRTYILKLSLTLWRYYFLTK